MALTKNLNMVRGDTFAFQLVLTDLEDDVASIFFTAKKRATDEAVVFQKSFSDGITLIEANKYAVRVSPSDTAGVAAGRYTYDLQIGIGDDIYTIMMGNLQIVQDVTGGEANDS